MTGALWINSGSAYVWTQDGPTYVWDISPAGEFVSSAEKLRNRLIEGFTDLPLRWPNDDREASIAECPDGFVYSEIEVHTSQQIGVNGTIGVPWRDYGRLTALVYVPRGVKIGRAEMAAQQIRALFGVNSVPGVYVTRKTIGVGQGVDSTLAKYFCVPVSVEWFADRTE